MARVWVRVGVRVTVRVRVTVKVEVTVRTRRVIAGGAYPRCWGERLAGEVTREALGKEVRARARARARVYD